MAASEAERRKGQCPEADGARHGANAGELG